MFQKRFLVHEAQGKMCQRARQLHTAREWNWVLCLLYRRLQQRRNYIFTQNSRE